MHILLSWLEDFVEIKESPNELADALTMAGMAVDAVERDLGETIFEFDITSNRPDALNHLGMAREVAAIYRRSLRLPAADLHEQAIPASSRASVAIEDPHACARYVGRVFEDVRVEPSPDRIRRRLELCGVRSINNLADLTNYVLLEIGQPTHAFDLDKLAGQRIIVRRARSGETLRTLDGIPRELSPAHLAICDAERPVALAGVMGGAETEITDTTRNVLLEAAWFSPSVIRKASRHFKLHTEASHRFERGADWQAAPQAADRIGAMLHQSGRGSLLAGRIDCYPRRQPLDTVQLLREQVRQHLGIALEDSEIESILTALGFAPTPTSVGWQVPCLSSRLDVTRGIDLVEEVARIHGFSRIPSTLPAVGAAPAATANEREEERMRAGVRALGYDETIGFSFISSEDARRFGGAGAVELRNPLSRLWDVMRNSAVPTMLQSLQWNLRRNRAELRLAEFGRIYRRSAETYREPRILALGASGSARPATWSDRAPRFSFHDLKADVTALLSPYSCGPLRFDASGIPDYYDLGQSASVRGGERTLARFGRISRTIAGERKLRQPVWIAEIWLDEVYACGLAEPAHRPLPRVPAVSRDFSLLVPESVQYQRITEAAGTIQDVERTEAVEIYRGKNVPRGRYSLLFRVWWQRLDESLTDESVNSHAEKLLSRLASRLGIKLRA
ncbi:MAG: phenylalanine--tRNA ligase subunit beta [Bryobacterales bacterium]|nr:phenylalanine--tRNA ligase subunit beta [Bryobacterales bacterium]